MKDELGKTYSYLIDDSTKDENQKPQKDVL